MNLFFSPITLLNCNGVENTSNCSVLNRVCQPIFRGPIVIVTVTLYIFHFSLSDFSYSSLVSVGTVFYYTNKHKRPFTCSTFSHATKQNKDFVASGSKLLNGSVCALSLASISRNTH